MQADFALIVKARKAGKEASGSQRRINVSAWMETLDLLLLSSLC
jgi:hypothetical protein